MNRYKIILLGTAAILAAGCANDNEPGAPVGKAVRFTASVAAVATPATRTTDGGDKWETGAPVGIYMLTAGGNPATSDDVLTDNAEYNITNAGQGTLAPTGGTPIYYPQDGATVYFVAYYPYDDAAMDCTIDLTVAEQTSETVQNALDVLYARTPDKSKSSAAVALTFDHVLSKVTLNVKLGDGLTALSGDKITAVALSDMPVEATLDLANGGLTAGSTDDFTALKTAVGNGAVKATFTALLIPQEENEYAGRTATFTVGGTDYVWTIPDSHDFAMGQHYTYTVTVSRTGVTVSAPDIAPWDGVADDDNAAGSGESELMPPKKNSRITWKNGRYALTNDPHDAGLYFKFGSVVGIFTGDGGVATLPAGANGDTFNLDDLAWSPVEVTDWNNIPVYGGKPATAVNGDYHTLDNVRAGKGDPCRLVGLDLADILTNDAAQIDNRTWRLPTRYENEVFVGQYTSFSYWQTLNGVNGHQFPEEDTFLPATGYRVSNGSVDYQSSAGYYWSSTVSGTTGHYLALSISGVSPSGNGSFTSCYAVRCIRQ